MRLTAQEEYGLRCLLQVAKQADVARTTPEIAERAIALSRQESVHIPEKLQRMSDLTKKAGKS